MRNSAIAAAPCRVGGSATELFAANAKLMREGSNGVLLGRGPWCKRLSYHRHRLVARVAVLRRRPRWPFSRRFALRWASAGDEAARRRTLERSGRSPGWTLRAGSV